MDKLIRDLIIRESRSLAYLIAVVAIGGLAGFVFGASVWKMYQ